eukprot:gnl/TRDRNA2_/TRDRNA2_73056_c1_seq1.p1 gnl/TRDRNA2_/TRDRNA2_73056_c1~~gnl/TRDRNA2_/TRDRNA2_73056_c1_seq1.p1  ORF type:complete len:505 (-),score=65.26 gnl/TRDRNA2_/TRDRNA2_73056_c1_seq1:42-1427(-)
MCYAEFASRYPVAGSAYTFTYIQAGEFLAWNVAWGLVRDYVVGGAAIAVGWSSYTRSFLHGLGLPIPSFLAGIPLGPYITADVMALTFIFVLTIVVGLGVNESKWLNHVVTAVKLSALVLVSVVAFGHADTRNWADFAPNGVDGIAQGAAIVMFAYTGFDICCSAAEEAINPQWSLPVGVLTSVFGSTIVYVLVAASLTLMVSWQEIDLDAPVAEAFAGRVPWMVPVVSASAVVGLFAIGNGAILASSRLLMTLGRDGLLPGMMSTVHPKTQTPLIAVWLCGIGAMVLTLFFSFERLTQMVSMGTMVALSMVCIDLLILRKSYRDEVGSPAPRAGHWLLPVLIVLFISAVVLGTVGWHVDIRGMFWSGVVFALLLAICILMVPTHAGPREEGVFIVPLGSGVALVGVLLNVAMICSLTAVVEWMIVTTILGLVLYFAYGLHFSKLAEHQDEKLPLNAGRSD